MEPYPIGTPVKISEKVGGLGGVYIVAAVLPPLLGGEVTAYIVKNSNGNMIYDVFSHFDLIVASTKGKKLEEYF